jgi:hypothetical protein
MQPKTSFSVAEVWGQIGLIRCLPPWRSRTTPSLNATRRVFPSFLRAGS